MNYFNDAQILFETRYEEVSNYFAHIDTYFTQIATSSRQSDMIEQVFFASREHEFIIRSNILLMIYNMFESSFLELYKTFYDFLKDLETPIDNMNEIFVYGVYKKMRRNKAEITSQIRNHLTTSSNGLSFSRLCMKVSFDLDEEERKFLINGNLDGRKIKETFADFGLPIDGLDELNWESLVEMKQNRQQLTHGGMSFSDVGKTLSLDGLKLTLQAVCQLFEYCRDKLTAFCQSHDNVSTTTRAV